MFWRPISIGSFEFSIFFFSLSKNIWSSFNEDSNLFKESSLCLIVFSWKIFSSLNFFWYCINSWFFSFKTFSDLIIWASFSVNSFVFLNIESSLDFKLISFCLFFSLNFFSKSWESSFSLLSKLTFIKSKSSFAFLKAFFSLLNFSLSALNSFFCSCNFFSSFSFSFSFCFNLFNSSW